MKRIIVISLAVVILVILFFPCLFIRNISGFLIIKPLIGDVDLKINYIHSVQKTPVEECLKINKFDKIRLYETRYQSFGVGLPFSEEDGEFHQEGNFFVLKMNRQFKNLFLRVGKETNLTLNVDGDILPVYRTMAIGSRVEIYVEPFIIGRFFK